MNITSLKLLALISMLIDHMGIVFFYDVISFRIIGRISFPIYAFLISNGCKYSKNIYNYAIKLFLLAIISEIPYDLMMFGKISTYKQNTVFTLALGCLCIIIYKNIKNSYERNITILFICILGKFLNIDYGIYGIILVLFTYIFRKNIRHLLMVFILINLLITFQSKLIIQIFACFSIVPIFIYNENKKICNYIQKNIFYIFYPIHMLILYLMNNIIL